MFQLSWTSFDEQWNTNAKWNKIPLEVIHHLGTFDVIFSAHNQRNGHCLDYIPFEKLPLSE